MKFMNATQLLLQKWLKQRLKKETFVELQRSLPDSEEQKIHPGFFTAFSEASRKFPLSKKDFSDQDKQDAELHRIGWQPGFWSEEELLRIYMLLSVPVHNSSEYAKIIHSLFQTADLKEAIAMGKALPILPFPHEHIAWARKLLRSNAQNQFESVALHNPFPKDYFDENGWNQMILKALFIGSDLRKIQGLDEKRNESLATMLCDYAQERWKAGRRVSPQLWRCIGPYLIDSRKAHLEKVLQSEYEQERRAGWLMLRESSFREKQDFLKSHSKELEIMKTQNISWESIDESI